MAVWQSLKDPLHGVGMRSCPHLEARALVRNRCLCTSDKCRQEWEELQLLIRQGKMPGTTKPKV